MPTISVVVIPHIKENHCLISHLIAAEVVLISKRQSVVVSEVLIREIKFNKNRAL